jgi:hypothetical protein
MVGLGAFMASEIYKVRTSQSLEASNLQAEMDIPDLKKALADKKEARVQKLFNERLAKAEAAAKAKAETEAQAEVEADTLCEACTIEVEAEETQTEEAQATETQTEEQQS